ncbi:MAG: hypothetical protein C4547_13070 [Phycisphaerales bacterium]|nr:MAG: hypothetical protein C4547_13070 [Phycisphaerales bacterium]
MPGLGKARNRIFINPSRDLSASSDTIAAMNRFDNLAPVVHTIVSLLVALALCGAAGAQEAESEPPPADHVGHTRHHHRHNEPHPSAPDGSRFTTSRTGAVLPLPSETDAFTFAIFGDRTGGPVEGVAVLADAVRDVNLLEPDFVITVGDLVEGYNATPQWMEQMREFKGIMDMLLCPWFPVAGNHDIYWRGPAWQRPAGEHEQRYETHFGPLWYAFEHKNCWFIALYSDEGDPESGEKDFRRPECQKMSPEQFDWLEQTLEKAADADHVFLFLHHPRWIGGGYGDDWDRVHELLKSAGNVTAVFAGHIHRMRYDGPKDGIEYVTLATTGGGQSGRVPSAGMLHHFDLVTVRKSQVAMAAIPVGGVIDVRDITQPMVNDMLALNGLAPDFSGPTAVASDGATDSLVGVTLRNPSGRAIEVLAAMDSRDSRWRFAPDHDHAVIQPGDTCAFRFNLRRSSSGWDRAFRSPQLVLDVDYLTDGARYPCPQRRISVPLDLTLPRPPEPAVESALVLGGDDALAVPSESLALPDGPLTLECWFNAETFGARTALIAKTENSDYGIFVSQGKPAFSIFVGGSYLQAAGEAPMLEAGRWHHVAGVYDGREARLYLDGTKVGAAERDGVRGTNAFPLMIGADVNGRGEPMSHFKGRIDAVRLSTVARYDGQRFTPARRAAADDDCVLVLNMDGIVGPWLFDESPRRAHVLCPEELELSADGR